MRSVKFVLPPERRHCCLQLHSPPTCLPSPRHPCMPPQVEEFGGWYLRGDVGFSNQRVDHLDTPGYHDPDITVPPTIGLGFDTAGSLALGAGYISTTGFAPTSQGSIGANPLLHGLDIVSFNGVVLGTD